MKKLVFSTSILGASHIRNKKPCQDYSIVWLSDDSDTAVLIVCDGHGSDTYVRSDVGARLAGEITLDCVRQFLLPFNGIKPDSEWIIGTKGAVTSREEDVMMRYSKLKPKDEKDMTETDWMRYRQRLEFREQIKDKYEQDAIFQALFGSVYEKWLDAIQLDSLKNPFTDEEKELIGKHELKKAYGTTLMTYVQTPEYWFALQIR